MPSPPRTCTRRKGLPSTGSNIFATRLEIASTATVQALRSSSSSQVPQDAVSLRCWPLLVVQLPRNPDSRRDVRWGHNIEAIPCIAGVASARCARLLCQFGYDVHQGIVVLSPRGRARIANPPGSRFFCLTSLLIEPVTPTLFFRLPEQTRTKTASLVRILSFRSVSCLAKRRCSAEVENRRHRHTNHDTATLKGGT